MNDPFNPQPDIYPAEMRDQALTWFLQLQDAPDDLVLKGRFEQWLQANDQHEACYLDILLAWQDVAQCEQELTQADKQIAATPVADHSSHTFGSPLPVKTQGMRFGYLLALLPLLAITYMLMPFGFWTTSDYITARGEQSTVQLPDGSTMHLAPETLIDVAFSESARTIALKQGEAFFEVAKDSQRPFSVITDNMTVTALGTAFNVRVLGDSVQTTLTEGRLSIRAEGSEVAQMDAGQQLQWISRDEHSIRSGQFSYLPGWKKGMVRLDGISLSDTLELLNRHSEVYVQLVDPRLSDQPLQGVLPLNDLDTAMKTIKIALNAETTVLGEQLILLYQKN